MAQVSKLVAELALCQAKGEFFSRDDLLAMAHMLNKQCSELLASASKDDDYGVLNSFLSRIDELPGQMEVAFLEADAIRGYNEPKIVLDLFGDDWTVYKRAAL